MERFIHGDKVVALQFHLEVSPESLKGMVESCREELVDGAYIQSEKDILSEEAYFETNHQVQFQFLDYLCSLIS